MAIIVHNCPHCPTANAALSIIGVQVFPAATAEDAGIDVHKARLHRWPISVGVVCPSCSLPSAATLASVGGSQNYSLFNDLAKRLASQPNEVGILGFKLVDIWPTPAKPQIPEHIPASVERSMLQAERNFPVSGNEEASAMMYRRSLEIALKDLFPEMTGMLGKRIKKLVSDKLLPQAMGEWADEIKSLGNDAAHEPDEVDRGELQRIRGFTDATLRYLYTLPAEIAARRKIEQ